MECNGLPQVFSNLILQRTNLYKRLFSDPSFLRAEKPFAYIRISLIASGVLPLSANIFALFLLQRPQLKRDQPTFRHHLVLLTISEIFYSAAFINFFFWDVTYVFLAVNSDLGLTPAVVVAVSGSVAYAAQATRNWMVAAISVARCEALTRPLTSLRKKFITISRVRIFIALTFASTLSISLLAALSNFWVILCIPPSQPRTCPDDNSSLAVNSTNTKPQFILSVPTVLRNLFQVTYFRGLPIIVVIINTVIMIVALNCKKQVPTLSQAKSATSTLIGFTILFSIFEGFGFAMVSCLFLKKLVGLSAVAGHFFYISDKYLLMINSMTNVLAYVAFNKTFRSVAMDLFRLKKYRKTQPSTIQASSFALSSLHK